MEGHQLGEGRQRVGSVARRGRVGARRRRVRAAVGPDRYLHRMAHSAQETRQNAPFAPVEDHGAQRGGTERQRYWAHATMPPDKQYTWRNPRRRN